MKRLVYILTKPARIGLQDFALLLFRIGVSLELIFAHGLKKVGIGVATAEQIPNPLQLPASLNNTMAIAANLFFPLLVILGLFTRLSVLPILAVTLTGYFVLHWHDPLLVKDIPYMYSLCFLLLFITGAGRFSIDHRIAERFNH